MSLQNRDSTCTFTRVSEDSNWQRKKIGMFVIRSFWCACKGMAHCEIHWDTRVHLLVHVWSHNQSAVGCAHQESDNSHQQACKSWPLTFPKMLVCEESASIKNMNIVTNLCILVCIDLWHPPVLQLFFQVPINHTVTFSNWIRISSQQPRIISGPTTLPWGQTVYCMCNCEQSPQSEA